MTQYAGIDVSLEASYVCVVDAEGKIVREAKVLSEPDALISWFAGHLSTPSASSSDPPKQKSPLPWVRPHWGRARDALADDRGAWGPAAA